MVADSEDPLSVKQRVIIQALADKYEMQFLFQNLQPDHEGRLYGMLE